MSRIRGAIARVSDGLTSTLHFVHSFIRSFVRLFVHSFIRDSIHRRNKEPLASSGHNCQGTCDTVI
jgi:hypothetical protein